MANERNNTHLLSRELERLQARVRELERAEAQFKQTEEILRKRTHDLGERVKELKCLYSISKLMEKPEASIEEILRAAVALLPPAWQYPEITCARILLEDRTFRTRPFRLTPWKQASDINVHGKRVGALEVYYTRQMPDCAEGPFLAEERSLLNVLVEQIGSIVERKRAEAALREHQRKLQISEQNLKEFSHRILSIREEEKKRLSINLHDEIGGMVVSLNSCLSIAEQEIREGNLSRAHQSLRQTQDALQKSVESLKALAIDLRPPNLDILGLPSALRVYFGNVSKQTGLQIDFQAKVPEKALRDDVAITLYRVAQEALNNVVKHARATTVAIRLTRRAGRIRFSIQDNGRGFDARRALSKTDEFKIGILGMRERVESLNGTFAIRSSPGKGACILITLPVAEVADS